MAEKVKDNEFEIEHAESSREISIYIFERVHVRRIAYAFRSEKRGDDCFPALCGRDCCL